ncbi:helix-turn-helix domain-containing protein [Aliarcobacter butzleri]|uniref:helix-turn-helix domain-containing protein n=1 Tax=Aliarcobacter butzleri TaxID=28197 RepID=UPI0021B4CCCD|nr:helix-turn-helix domain-containing protein [Aliarcobacter butzleri]MCT7601289.1 helix-turn-helix domain-containing protein [Aliarcobacter butzleri]
MSNIYNKLLTDEQKELYSLMLPVYGALVSQKTTAKILNVSIATLYRMRENCVGVSYKKLDSKSKNGTVVYPLQEIVKFLSQSNVKTA